MMVKERIISVVVVICEIPLGLLVIMGTYLSRTSMTQHPEIGSGMEARSGL